jgi:hypothetical protein
MPGLYRKILIFAAIDGIIIQPLEQKGQRSGLVKIAYKDKSIASVKDAEGSGKGFEAFGVVGMRSTFQETRQLAYVLHRSFDRIQIVLLDLDYQTPASSTNTRETCLCHYGSSFDAAIFELRSRTLNCSDQD